jgi:DNA (cytosine-5)-methyltransferase 1
MALTEDIREIDPRSVRKRLRLDKEELDLVAGGPPCQGFSINAPVRSLLDERNHLFKEFLRFVKAFSPKAVLIENVPGLVSFGNGLALRSVIDALGEFGYGADVRILGAAHYGVPQTRWRTFVMGLKGRDVPAAVFPEPLFNAPIRANFTATFNGRPLLKTPAPETKSGFVTVSDAIGDLPVLRNGERGEPVKPYMKKPSCGFQERSRAGSGGVLNHEATRLSEINVQRMRHIRPGGNWTDMPDSLLPKGMLRARKSDHTKRYGRVDPNGLASTILTKCDPHWGAYFHYSQDRAFTVREAARIQSFPDRFVFAGIQARQFAQVGNAVPPLLASAVGASLKSVLLNGA